MQSTDFAEHLTQFLTVYLPAQKNASKNTTASYRDTFKLLLQYCQEQQGIPPHPDPLPSRERESMSLVFFGYSEF